MAIPCDENGKVSEITSAGLDVFVVANAAYATGAAATLTSVLASARRPEALRFVILCDEPAVFQPLLELLRRKTEAEAIAIGEAMTRWRVPERWRWHFSRYLVPSLARSERALYLDTDMLCLLDVGELGRRPLEGHPTGAVVDTVHARLRDDPSLTVDPPIGDQPYFNTGLLLFDCAAWQTEQLPYALEAGAQGALCFQDQSAFNRAFAGRVARLPDAGNLFATHINNRAWTDPAVVHFVTAAKPWVRWRPWHAAHHAWHRWAEGVSRLISLNGWRKLPRAPRWAARGVRGLPVVPSCHRFGRNLSNLDRLDRLLQSRQHRL